MDSTEQVPLAEMQRLLELVPPVDPRDVPGSSWTELLLADWLNRRDRGRGGDPYLAAVVDERRVWRSCRELRCQWRANDGDTVYTWQSERSLLGNPHYQMRISCYDARGRWRPAAAEHHRKRPHPDELDRFVREGRRRSEEEPSKGHSAGAIAEEEKPPKELQA